MNIGISSIPNLTKPTPEKTGYIYNHMVIKDISISSLRSYCALGMTFHPAVCEDDHRGKFISQQAFFVDVDNTASFRSVQEQLNLCERYAIPPSLIYKTFSGTIANQKHRLVFCTETPITDLHQRNQLQKELIDMFAADTSCSHIHHLFYGGDCIYFYNPSIYLDPKRLHQAYQKEMSQ